MTVLPARAASSHPSARPDSTYSLAPGLAVIDHDVMVQAADLQGSALFNRLQGQHGARAALQQLIADPITFLGAHRFYGNAGNGHLSAVQPTPFELRPNGDVRMGINAAPGSPNVMAIVTPTRANTGPGFANRRIATQRFVAGQGAAQLWLTDQQTGCSVLILDWGASFSMVHILPHQRSSYGRTLGGLMWLGGTGVEASVQNYYLRDDVRAVAQASAMGGAMPHRYILVQSQYSLNHRQLLQVVGVARAGGWDFYVQTIQVTPAGQNVQGVQRMPWRNWQQDWFWRNATS